MPLQATSGAASYDAFGGGVPVAVNYIEDVFSTYLYTGNATSRSINNGIDLLGKGGLLWAKSRDSSNSLSNYLVDTARGDSFYLYSEATNAQANLGAGNSFSNTGFNLSSNVNLNANTEKYASWTFRKQPKFFDVVTYSGSSSTQNIAHNLGSVPGCIIVKRTSGAEDWFVYHTSLGNTQYLKLNTTGAAASGFAAWNNTSPTSTQFTVLGGRTEVNAAGSDYVAYLFAHNAGGFGLTGTDNVISCGSFTANANTTVSLGYEPQWIMFKNTNGTNNWAIIDAMRGWTADGDPAVLSPNLSAAEVPETGVIKLTSTGFQWIPAVSGNTYIYIAIRRGPMKVPTSGTSVFEPALYTGNGSTSRTFTTSTVAPIDLSINLGRTGTGGVWTVDRLRGNEVIRTWSTAAGVSSNTSLKFDVQNGYSNTGTAVNYDWNTNTLTNVQYFMKRAPSFFDEVCYTGTGSATTVTHNLGVVPEMMIVKGRTNAFSWFVYQKDLTTANQSFLTLNSDSAVSTGSAVWNSTSPTSSVFSIGSANAINQSGQTFVAYLFATCAGVSKVGSYTGTGTTLQIDCGFTAGSRFVLIKRTDSTGDWYVWDSARGIVAGNDPYLLLNSTAAEVTNTDYVDTYSAGFEISSTAPSAINASGGTFIFFAVS